MATPKTKTVPKSVQIAALVALVVGGLFVSPYFGVILFSALVAYIFNPVYLEVLKRTKRASIAISATLVVATLCFVLPLALVIGITVSQANSLLDKYATEDGKLNSAQLEDVVTDGTSRVNQFVTGIPGGENFSIDKNDVVNSLKDAATSALNGFVDFIVSAGGAVSSFISGTILAIFLIASLLKYQKELLKFLQDISPFHKEVTGMYLYRAGAMTRAMVKGQLLIAICQGAASAFSLWLVGMDYFWFFFMILTFLSFIPLGGGILTIPIGIIYMLTGNIVQGVFLIAFHLLVVTNIDNVLRPRLVPKDARLNQALVLLSVFAGVAMFGPTGVVYGPVIMILLVATLQMYSDYNKLTTKPHLAE